MHATKQDSNFQQAEQNNNKERKKSNARKPDLVLTLGRTADVLDTTERSQAAVEKHAETLAVHSVLGAGISGLHFPVAEALAHLLVVLVVKLAVLGNQQGVTLEAVHCNTALI